MIPGTARVWVQGNHWTPGGEFHAPDVTANTLCGIPTAGHGAITTAAQACDDWRMPCRECFGNVVIEVK